MTKIHQRTAQLHRAARNAGLNPNWSAQGDLVSQFTALAAEIAQSPGGIQALGDALSDIGKTHGLPSALP